jgi:hypothetical protein
MKATVINALNEVLNESWHQSFAFQDGTDLFRETQIDSLALALVIVKLEELTGKDPFKGGFISFRTVGELVRLYENA